jgi:hypothetical protein
MELFRIKKFKNDAEGRHAEETLRKIGISAVLSDSSELYVYTEHVDKVIETLSLPTDAGDTPQSGPWCTQCGNQLVLTRVGSTRFQDLRGIMPGLLAPARRWYCHTCEEEIKDTSAVIRLRRRIKRTLVSKGYHSKPSFIIIGAQRAGTTAMFRILRQHPQIVAPRKKELHFFDSMRIRYGDFVTYHEMFPLPHELKPDKLTYEASPSYLYNPDCPERIYRYSPGIRLIVILREPISRAFSAWNMHKGFTRSINPYLRLFADHRSFEEAIKQEVGELEKKDWKTDKFSYIKRGMYVEQLERYLQYLSRDSLLIIEHSHLMRDPQSVFASAFRFLQIDDRVAVRTLRFNVTKYDNEIRLKAWDLLKSVFKPYNQRLFNLLGREYDW